ncbi:uncharacterized protein PV09_08373 [Verruconis gallopava]|uniref:ubiquitinyl hydrolase 1 n=1 Tax=Verruconis gallopava TaxID=253628 RepID=A0A0D1XCS1_9PEZI|nr:uncharacterized protein PV09_08373 [Verruconis gallopava]KIW00021.1 hypothetical protein PV09_08373 [Verruconis gallopava]
MNGNFATLEEIYEHAAQHTIRIAHSTDYTSSAVAVVLFSIFACLVWPLLSDGTDPGSKFFNVVRNMASRIGFGLVRRPASSETGALATVFGVKNNAGVGGLKTLGSETLQRGIGGFRSIMAKSTSGDDTVVPAGLGNWDNSCYQNSVIQGLASLRCLPDFLGRVATKMAAKEGPNGGRSMNEALLDMLAKLNDVAYSGRALWLPSELKTMSTWQQQDAQEYFSKILDKLDKEAMEVAKKDAAAKEPVKLSLDDTRSTGLEERLHGDNHEARNRLELRNPLDGMIAQRVGCKTCGHSDGLSLFPFNCLTVPLGRASHYDIRDCLDAYTALEDIDGVQCPKCTLMAFQAKLSTMVSNASSSETLKQQLEERLQAVQDALDSKDFSDNAITRKCQIPKKQWVESTKTKQAVVARAPQGLVLHVNRSMFNEFTGAQIKNPAVVHFPATFELGPWMLGALREKAALSGEREADGQEEYWAMDPQTSMLPSAEELVASDARYELRAVVTHFGRHENGHYVCYRKFSPPPTASRTPDADVAEETWWRLSDEDVTKVGEDYVLRQGGVFMLFYEKIEELPQQQKTMATISPLLEAVSAVEPADVPLPLDDDEDLEEDLEPEISVPISHDEKKPIVTSLGDGSFSKPDGSPRQLPTPPESVAESAIESDLDSVADEHLAAVVDYPREHVQAIRMRTSNQFSEDRNKGNSNESLLMGSRMVSAS